ncbi:EAL domain-containing response regulator [Aquincola tertiaricarbonis]|uniref:EAL domain-containing response regulator n=1 Tax=Aquincola tertiaricarbonis TaxID=391953 RepID=UPI0006153313|nr:EAL domain-containing response regulator [Aquincola tertiaricarbonis]
MSPPSLPSDRPQAARDVVLVVDDSLVQRQHAVSLCRALGVSEVHEAQDGEDALRRLAGLPLPPTLMVIDLEMPVMDGFELIQHLGRHGVRSPFVVASSREGALMRAVEAMAATLSMRLLAGVAKPLTSEVMAAALEASQQMQASGEAPSLPSVPQPIAPDVLALAVAQGRVTPQFQPKVDIRTGLVRGVEALARWTDPVLGMVPPDRFIATAEQHGIIGDLTRSVMDQSLAQLARWSARGLRLSMAVNLSPLSLQTPGLVEGVTALLARHGVAPSQLVLEITESAAVASDAATLSVLARLRMRGVGLSIDDYGTGFSSMQQLARVPCTELKIDRSFVHGAHRSPHLKTLLQSALEMAGRLGLVSVAEGVETMEDWRLLQQSGCNVGQGYLVARPMPGDAVARWLGSHEARLPDLRRPE